MPPLERSAPKRKRIVIIDLILGILIGTALAYVEQYLKGFDDSPEDQRKKIDEIREAFIPARFLRSGGSAQGDRVI